jgi:phosphonate transport system substrate-binding protein
MHHQIVTQIFNQRVGIYFVILLYLKKFILSRMNIRFFVSVLWLLSFSTSFSQNLLPKELIVAIGHTKMDKKGVEIDKQLQEYLAKKLNMPVKVTYPKDIFAILEKIDSNAVHVVDINPFGYVMASLNDKVDVLAIRGNKNREVETYNSCIVVGAKSPIKKIDDIKKLGAKSEMVFVHAASTSGHLVPRLYLNSIKIDVEIIFKSISFKGTHLNVIEYIKNTPNAVGACAYSFLQDQIKSGKFDEKDFRVLWISSQIPHGPVAVLKDLEPNFRKKLQEAYLAIPTEAPELWKMIVANWNAKLEDTTYIAGSDEAFDALRNITNQAEDLILILNFYRE